MIAAVNGVIGVVYYGRVAKTMWIDHLPTDRPDDTRQVRTLRGSLGLALGIPALFLIIAGVLPFQLAAIFADVAKVVPAGT